MLTGPAAKNGLKTCLSNCVLTLLVPLLIYSCIDRVLCLVASETYGPNF